VVTSGQLLDLLVQGLYRSVSAFFDPLDHSIERRLIEKVVVVVVLVGVTTFVASDLDALVEGPVVEVATQDVRKLVGAGLGLGVTLLQGLGQLLS